MAEVDEVRLLRTYRADYEDTRQQIRSLTAKSQVLGNAIGALEAVLRLHGVDPDQIGPDESPSRRRGGNATASTRAARPEGVIAAVVAVLSDAGKHLGAKEIQRRLVSRDLVVTYHSLYRAMKRDAASPNGALARKGENFSLREHANNAADAQAW